MTTPGCDCGRMIECFGGKCLSITLAGIFSGSDPGDCDCCEVFNTTYRATSYVTTADCANCETEWTTTSYGLGLEDFCDCFNDPSPPETGSNLVGVDIRIPCDGTDALTGSVLFHIFRSGTLGVTGFTWINFGITDPTLVRAAIDQLCAGNSVILPFLSMVRLDGDSPPCYADDLATMTLHIDAGEDCTTAISYNCDSGVCTKLHNDTGTYATLAECITSPCANPPATYTCVDGTCTDPQDGTGVYSRLDDCVSSGCGAPTCGHLTDACGPTLVCEIHDLLDCGYTGYEEFLSHLNRVYFLHFREASSDFFGSLVSVDGGGDPITGDYSDPGILWRRESSGAVHDEHYVYAIAIRIECTDGQVTMADLTIYEQRFFWTDPDPPAVTSTSTFSLGTVTDTLAGTEVGCTVGYMLTLFSLVDCNGVTRTFWIDGTVG